VIDGARRALVVAHPDDEAMWFAGALIRHPGDWTIICCSIPLRDPGRAYKFFGACRVLGANGRLVPFPESAPSLPLNNLDLLDLSEYDDILTHNWEGEYGHQHHKAVHQHIVSRWPGRLLVSGYGLPGEPDYFIALGDEEYERKLTAIRCYDHVSPSDNGVPKSEALLARYGAQFNLKIEPYVRYRA
jgi:LmbE family N-acetylglucosaminyl deacetylase